MVSAEPWPPGSSSSNRSTRVQGDRGAANQNWELRSYPAAPSPARPTSTPSWSKWLPLANSRTVRRTAARPDQLVVVDRAAMLALPPIAPNIGFTARVRLPRDYYVRVAGNDYSMDAAVIARMVQVRADLAKSPSPATAAGSRSTTVARRRVERSPTWRTWQPLGGPRLHRRSGGRVGRVAAWCHRNE